MLQIISLHYFTAGLSLLAKHAAQFKEYLAKDTEVCAVWFCPSSKSNLYSFCSTCIVACIVGVVITTESVNS